MSLYSTPTAIYVSLKYYGGFFFTPFFSASTSIRQQRTHQSHIRVPGVWGDFLALKGFRQATKGAPLTPRQTEIGRILNLVLDIDLLLSVTGDKNNSTIGTTTNFRSSRRYTSVVCPGSPSSTFFGHVLRLSIDALINTTAKHINQSIIVDQGCRSRRKKDLQGFPTLTRPHA